MHLQKNFRRLLILIGIITISVCALYAQATKEIPAADKKRSAPFLFSAETVAAGDKIFQANCNSCHGDPGKNNYAKLNPEPGDPASAKYQKNLDGEMFYLLTHGKGALMPQFATTLTEDQRWQVISYVRSFNKNYKQPPVAVGAQASLSGNMAMVLLYNATTKEVVASITDSTGGKKKPVANATVKLFVKRTFGNLSVAESTTDAEGLAKFNFPTDIPGDTAGNLTLVALAGSNGKELSTSKVEKIGVPVKVKNQLDERAMWNISSMAPIWLIIVYTVGVLGILATLGYIFHLLKKIREINNKKQE